MNTKLWRLIAGAMAFMLVAACGSTTPAMPPPDSHPITATAPTDLDRIVDQGSVRVCSTGDYRPFSYHDARGWSGMDVELAQDLAARLGVKLKLIQVTWSSMLTDLGVRCDMAMGGITITSSRAQHALFSAPYLRDGKAAIVRCADSSKYQTLAEIDRPGVRVVVNPGGTNAEFDQHNIHQASILEYPDNNTIFDQVANNHADVMVTDVSEIRWETVRNPQLCGPDIDHPFTFEQKAYLIPRDDPGLQQWVDQWLNIVRNDGTYARITREWLGQVVHP